jgi:hypothetical protein
VPTARQLAILATTETLVRTWPLAARIAFRDAVLQHTPAFCGERWDIGEVLIAVHEFARAYTHGVPWPPPPVNRAAVAALADRLAALGVELTEAMEQDSVGVGPRDSR